MNETTEPTEPTEPEMSKETLEEIAIKYAGIEEFCEDADQFNNVSHELALFETVLSQINEIFKSTLYTSEVDTMNVASDDTVDILRDSFAKEFVSNSKEEKKLASLPTLELAVAWIQEIHENLAKQLFTEEFSTEVLVPAYTEISEAIIGISNRELEDEAGEGEADIDG